MNDILLFFTLKYKGNWEQVYQALAEKEKVEKSEIEKLSPQIKKRYISIIDKNYPNSLKMIYKPPFSIFWDGDVKLFEEDLITLVGSYNKNCFEKIINSNKNYVFVVNYNQKDLIEKLIEHNCKIIVMYDHGLKKIQNDALYKKIKEAKNLIFSEIPNDCLNLYHEQYSHRILLGLSRRCLYVDDVKIKNSNIIEAISELEDIPIFTFFDETKEKFHKIQSLEEIKNFGLN